MYILWRKGPTKAKLPKPHESHNAVLDGSLKLAMVEIFTPQKSANATNQDLNFCFVSKNFL